MTRGHSKSFLHQLMQRKVTRVALAYVVFAWLAMQVGEVTFEALHLPEWSLTFLIAFLVVGFPVALITAWAYEVTPEGIRKDPNGAVSDPSAAGDYLNNKRPSIAVLPFYDMSEHGDQGYFCEGLAEEILNSLCKVEDLGVASRIASFQFGGEKADVREIGRRLRVKTVLEGTVRKSGDKLRITVELVDTKDGYHLWSRQYDRAMRDVFDIQQDIASSVAAALSLTFNNESHGAARRCDPRAYELLLRGNTLLARRRLQEIINARRLFIRSLEVDPECSRAWEGLATTYGFEYLYFNATEENLEKALETSAHAVKLEPQRAQSHVLAGVANTMARNFGKADESFRRALDLDPNCYEACYFHARMKVREGDFEAALECFERAADIRPDDYDSVLLQAQLHVGLGNVAEARAVSREGIERVRRALELNPNDNRALSLGAFALLRLGQEDEAEDWMQTSVRNAPSDSIVQYNAACFYALKGETETALNCLENCRTRVGQLNREWLENDSDLDSIRDDPRFPAIVDSVTG